MFGDRFDRTINRRGLPRARCASIRGFERCQPHSWMAADIATGRFHAIFKSVGYFISSLEIYLIVGNLRQLRCSHSAICLSAQDTLHSTLRLKISLAMTVAWRYKDRRFAFAILMQHTGIQRMDTSHQTNFVVSVFKSTVPSLRPYSPATNWVVNPTKFKGALSQYIQFTEIRMTVLIHEFLIVGDFRERFVSHLRHINSRVHLPSS